MSLRALRERLAPGAMTPLTHDTKHGVIAKPLQNQELDPFEPVDPVKPRGAHDSSYDRELGEAFAHAARDLPITSQELYETLAPEDIASWRDGELSGDNLRAFVLAVHESHEREAGCIPDSYQDIAICSQCGPVWLDMPGHVPSCPWCINRYNGWPIPRPGSVMCATCQHFQRTEHPHLGHCSAGIKPYGVAGHWDTDRHGCKHWLSA